MRINEMMGSEGAAVYYTESLRVMLESHMPYFRNHSQTEVTPLDPHLVRKYAGDFQGLMASMRIPTQYHWVYMRVNNLNGYEDLTDSMKQLYIVPVALIDRVVSSHRSVVAQVA